MRPIKLTGQNRVLQEVLREVRKFEYPDLDTLAPPFTAGGGGGAMTIQLACSDASEDSTSKADIQASGVADQDALQAAIERLTAQAGGGAGGRILISEGTLELSDNSVLTSANQFVTIQGMGHLATRIRTTDTTGTMIIFGQSNSELRDLTLVGTGASGPVGVGGTGNACRIHNVGFQQLSVGVDMGGDDWVIESCREFGAVSRLILARNGITGALITGNHFGISGAIDMDDALSWSIIGNLLAGSVLFDATGGSIGDQISILANHWHEGQGFNDILIEGIGGPSNILIASNYFECQHSWGIHLTGATNGGIASNHFFEPFRAIELASCSGVAITGNNSIDADEHAYVLDNSTQNTVQGNMASGSGQDTTNTFDHILLTGTSENNYVAGNKLIPGAQTRYGIADETDLCNIVVGNDLGDPSGYGTDALLQGAQTIIDYPNDPTYGDNFTDCGSGS